VSSSAQAVLVTVAKNEHWGGSAERFAESVASACLQRGLTGLLGQVLTYIATFGEVCFRTYKPIAADVVRSNGKNPHPESVGRIVRKLAELGHLEHSRIGPGKRPAGARWRSTFGTTENRILPTTLGVRRLARSERSRLRARAVQVLAPPAVAAVIGMGPPADDRPQFSAPTPAAVALASRARARNAPERRRYTQAELDALLELEPTVDIDADATGPPGE
jgi:hypothetical protein